MHIIAVQATVIVAVRNSFLDEWKKEIRERLVQSFIIQLTFSLDSIESVSNMSWHLGSLMFGGRAIDTSAIVIRGSS